jgi:TonB-dependent receptor
MIRTNNRLLIGASVLALIAVPGIAAAQDVPAPATASAPGDDNATDDNQIVVSGFRKSLETAQAIKKDSDQIIDSVVAEDIGKLPDQTGAESLARITGVSVERGTGEAAAVRVRGLPDLTTTYNGRELFTAEGRSVALQDFPAGTISRFDVYKTGSANLIEPGIAGEIDVRSHKPFDFKGTRIAGGITGLHWQNSQKFGLDANMLVSTRFNTGIGEIGFLIEGSYTDNKFDDDYRTNSNTIQTRGATQTFPRAQYPAVLTYQPDVSNRFRPSVGSTLQWRPSSDLELYSDFLFQGFRGRGRGYGLQINAGTAATLSNVEFCLGSTTQICKMTATGGNATSSYFAANVSQTDTYQAGTGFIWKPGRSRITGDFAFTDSVFTSNLYQVGMTTLTTGTRVFDFDNAEAGGGVAYVTDIDLTNPANWRYSGFSQSSSRTHGRSYQAKLDADVPVNIGPFDKLQFGIRFNDRSADAAALPTAFASGTITAGTAGSLLTAAPLELTQVDPSYTNDPLDHPRTWVIPTRDSVIHYFDYIRALASNAAVRTTGMPARVNSYDSNEKSYAAYLQTHYRFDLGGIRVDGQLGIRAVRTDNDINGLQTLTSGTPAVVTVTPISRQKQYYDYLPNISARFVFSPKLQARLAFTKTRTRPSFGQLNPTVTIGNLPTAGCTPVPPATTPDPTTCFRNASSGNPFLEPVKSTNYDASLEYYFSRSGSATIQVFQRDVIGFINNRTTSYDDPVLGRIQITEPENGEQGRIRGVEVGFRTFLAIPSLPKWMQNFGVLANYTYLDHWSVLSQAVQATLPGRQPITNVSNHLANAQIFYENKTLSLRASYNYRSSYRFYSAIDTTVGTLPTFEKGRGTLDLSGSITPVENISLTFNATNIIANPARNFRQFTRAGAVYPWQTRYLESIYRLGIRFRF